MGYLATAEPEGEATSSMKPEWGATYEAELGGVPHQSKEIEQSG